MCTCISSGSSGRLLLGSWVQFSSLQKPLSSFILVACALNLLEKKGGLMGLALYWFFKAIIIGVAWYAVRKLFRFIKDSQL